MLGQEPIFIQWHGSIVKTIYDFNAEKTERHLSILVPFTFHYFKEMDLLSDIVFAWMLILIHATNCLLRSLQRALDRRLYLLIYGNAHGDPSGKPVWHFPEKVYESEGTMRKVNVDKWLSFSFSVSFPY